MKYKIEFNRDICRGCGVCTSCENWKSDDDGKVSPIKTEVDKIGCNEFARDVCPVEAIKIIKQ